MKSATFTKIIRALTLFTLAMASGCSIKPDQSRMIFETQKRQEISDVHARQFYIRRVVTSDVIITSSLSAGDILPTSGIDCHFVINAGRHDLTDKPPVTAKFLLMSVESGVTVLTTQRRIKWNAAGPGCWEGDVNNCLRQTDEESEGPFLDLGYYFMSVYIEYNGNNVAIERLPIEVEKID